MVLLWNLLIVFPVARSVVGRVLEGHFEADFCIAHISKRVIYTKPLECAVFCFRIGCLLKNDPLPRFVLVCF